MAIFIDANERMGDEPAGLQRLTEALALTDIHANLLDPAQEPATYLRGEKRLDYALLNHYFLPHVQGCGFGPLQDGPTTDHRYGYLDLRLKAMLGGDVTAIDHLHGRSLTSNTPSEVAKYRELLHRHLLAHNVYGRLDRLLSLSPQPPGPPPTKLMTASPRE